MPGAIETAYARDAARTSAMQARWLWRMSVLVLGSSACFPSAFDRHDGMSMSGADAGPARDAAAGGRRQAMTVEPDAARDAGASEPPLLMADASTAASAPDAEPQGNAGASASAPDAMPHSPQPSMPEDSACGDTRTSLANCGSCGNDCRAPSAHASCSDGRCARACQSGYGDCNADLDFGAQGDGCETATGQDANHCGGCGIACDRPDGGVAACERGSCAAYFSVLDPDNVSVFGAHGNPDGGFVLGSGQVASPAQRCEPDEVLVGMRSVSADGTLYSIGVLCAAVSLNGAAGAFSLVFGPVRELELAGKNADIEVGPRVDERVQCPSGSVVNAVQGYTWNYPYPGNAGLDDATVPLVSQLSLRCARVILDASGQITLRNDETRSLGPTPNAAATPFEDTCGTGQVVVGFTGTAGFFLDSLQTHCARLAVERRNWSSTFSGVSR